MNQLDRSEFRGHEGRVRESQAAFVVFLGGCGVSSLLVPRP